MRLRISIRKLSEIEDFLSNFPVGTSVSNDFSRNVSGCVWNLSETKSSKGN